LGMFQQLKGSPALGDLAGRAWLALAAVVSAAACIYSAAYFRMLRKIVEMPDIVAGSRGGLWLPRFGNDFHTAVGQFSARALARSRRHRTISALYAGLGLAVAMYFLNLPTEKSEAAAGPVSANLLGASFAVMLLAIIGMRIAFAMPLDLQANWSFRIAPARGGLNCLVARRRATLVLGFLPVWIGFGAALFSLWPWKAAAEHWLALGLVGAIAAEICVYRLQRIPFTCSYMPGKTNIHLTLLFSVLVLVGLLQLCATYERAAMDSNAAFLLLLAGLMATLLVLRWRSRSGLDSGNSGIEYEDEGEPEIQGLGLGRL
jgi:hypothetical protein